MAGVATELPAHGIPDIGEPDRIELMQHRHLSVRVPPFSGKPGEAADLGGIDGSVGKGVCRGVCMCRLVGHVNDFASSSIVETGAEVAALQAHRYVYAPFCPDPTFPARGEGRRGTCHDADREI